MSSESANPLHSISGHSIGFAFISMVLGAKDFRAKRSSPTPELFAYYSIRDDAMFAYCLFL